MVEKYNEILLKNVEDIESSNSDKNNTTVNERNFKKIQFHGY